MLNDNHDNESIEANLCHIYDIDDAEEAHKQLDTEFVKGYGDETRLPDGTLLHYNSVWDDGYRVLLRCKHCGGMFLLQVSTYTSMSDEGHDGHYTDYLPVWSEEEADLLNTLLGPGEFEDHPFRHLRDTNHKYCWYGKEQPHPMDIEELKRAIALKYKDKFHSSQT